MSRLHRAGLLSLMVLWASIFLFSCSTNSGPTMLVPERTDFQPRIAMNEKPEETMSQPLLAMNQYGYHPMAPKWVITADVDAQSFSITSEEGTVVLRGQLKPRSTYDGQPRDLVGAEFTQLSTPGNYVLSLDGSDRQLAFSIGENVYSNLYRDGLRTYYYQRSATAITEEFGEGFTWNAGHPDTALEFDEDLGRTGSYSSPGGWYDAGDYGKYVVNGGITAGTLMSLMEAFPQGPQTADPLSIPESGNGVNDLLNEIRFELDWFKTMQDADGGVFFKVAGNSWPGFIAPDQDQQTRFVIGKSTTSTLNFSAVMAQASRVYGDIDPDFAGDALERAKRAFQWALDNPNVAEPSNGKGSGLYGDGDYSDEFFWAVAELASAGAGQEYLDLLVTTEEIAAGISIGHYLSTPQINGPVSWADTELQGYFTLMTHRESAFLADIRTQIEALAGTVVDYGRAKSEYTATTPYFTPMDLDDYIWGSNGGLLNYGVLFAYAYRETGEQEFLLQAMNTVNVVLGQNGTGFCHITGYGHRKVRNPHSRLMASDRVDALIPGFVVGGPNQNQEDALTYPSDLPEASYIDDQGSYASNETAINWNAPFVFVLGFLLSQL